PSERGVAADGCRSLPSLWRPQLNAGTLARRAMRYVEANLGVSTADAERVALRMEGGDLHLSFVDWKEQPRSLIFREVLAHRWQELDEPVPRDDTTFEALDSPWLARQANLQGVAPDGYAHYVLCFNACGVLDVLARRLSPG